jgi:hypothetical protein
MDDKKSLKARIKQLRKEMELPEGEEMEMYADAIEGLEWRLYCLESEEKNKEKK